MKAFEFKPEWLEYLQTVARTGSIRLAAEALYLTEHSLRYNFKQLEQFMQSKLFEKTAQGLELSPAGQRLLNNSQDFSRSLAKLEQGLQVLAENRMELKLGISSAYPSELLKPVFIRMRQVFPQLQLQVQIQIPVEIEKRVSLGAYDLGLITWAPNNSQLVSLTGPSWPGVFVRRRQGPVAENYFLPPAWRYFSQEPIDYPAQLAQLKVRYIGGTSLILNLCLEGAGIGYLPLSHVRQALKQGQLDLTAGPELDFSLIETLLVKDFDNLSKPAAYFIEQIQAHWQAQEQIKDVLN